uniref:Uncharacterized protein n=1 Tax=Avena sativa TaxID=4498 RepID=A0ACD5WKX9_AVESA
MEDLESVESTSRSELTGGDGDLESLESTSRPELTDGDGDGDDDGDLGSLENISGGSRIIEDILKAAGDGDLESLEKIEAKEKGAVAAARDPERCTALHLAASEGRMEVCQYLIKKLKVPVDVRDIHGETPLYRATRHGHVDTVRCLLTNKANPHVESRWGVTTLHEAASLGNSELVEILIDKRVKLNSQCYKQTPLACAIVSGSFDCFKALIKAGAAPTVIMYPLHAAAKSGSVEIVTWFLKAGRDPNACNKNSVIFDLTNKNKVQPSYVRAINAYRAWHFSGTDLTYEIGPHRKRFCVSRKDQTFIFWFRHLNQDVGLVIDGQAVWVEGMMRRTRGKDGRFKYSSPIQFTHKEDGSSSSSSKQKQVMTPPYIVHSELIEADYGGNYAGRVSKMKYSLGTTRSSVRLVSGHDKTKSLERDCHAACDNLVFLGTEAGKNLWIYEYGMNCFDPKLTMPLSVPECLDGTVTNHEQVSRNVLLALEAAAGKDLRDLPGGGYKIVKGAVFRTLWQCLNAYVILRRQAIFKTKFFLKGMEAEYRSQVKVRPQKKRHESDKEFEERLRKENVRTGTLFDPKLHGGITRHRLSVCPKPLYPSRKRMVAIYV